MIVWKSKVLGLIGGLMPIITTLIPAQGDELTVVPVTFPPQFYLAQQPGETTSAQDNVLEASGVEPIGDGQFLLVAHDKKVPLRVIETTTGKQVGPLLTSGHFPAETPKSSKWEEGQEWPGTPKATTTLWDPTQERPKASTTSMRS